MNDVVQEMVGAVIQLPPALPILNNSLVAYNAKGELESALAALEQIPELYFTNPFPMGWKAVKAKDIGKTIIDKHTNIFHNRRVHAVRGLFCYEICGEALFKRAFEIMVF